MSTSLIINPSIGTAPLTVNFSGITTIESGVYDWTFGDGNTSTGIAPTNIYTETGVYDVVLQISGLATSGIYLSTYIIDDFNDSGIDPGFHPDLTGLPVVDCSGYYIKHGAIPDTIVVPSGGGATITGRFDFQFDMVMGCSDSGNISLHSYFERSSLSYIMTFDWNNDKLEFNENANTLDAPWIPGRRYTVRGTRGYSLDSAGNPTKESVQVVRGYYLDNWSGGATNEWKEFPTSPSSGSTYDDDFYLVFDRADYNGYDNLRLQSDEGLTYSGLVSGYAVDTVSGTVIVGSGYGEILGDVVGVGFIDSTITENIGYSGDVSAWGDIRGAMNFVYTPTPVPPSGSSTAMRSIRTILTNKNRYPYKIPNDTIVSKVDIFDKNRISYRSDIPVELYFNYSGAWSSYESGVTDRFGSIRFTHSTASIPNINNCLGIAKATIDGKDYTSNIMRYNFVKGREPISTTPSGIEYNTYLWDDFGDNSGVAMFSGFWDPTWTGIYGLPVLRSGQYVVRDGRGFPPGFIDALPSGSYLSGDFSVVADMIHGSGWSYFNSYAAIALFTSVDSPGHPSYQIGFTNQVPGNAGSGSIQFRYRDPVGGPFGTPIYSPTLPWGSGYAFRVKFEREGDTISAFYDYNSGIWTELGSGLTLSGGISLTNIQTTSTTTDGEVTSLFNKFVFQADYGLPESI